MPTVLGTDGSSTSGGLLVGTGFNSLFLASSRHFMQNPTMHGRNTTTTYARGYRERINIKLGAGGTWSWRRVAFALKGPQIRNFWIDNSLIPPIDGLQDEFGQTTVRALNTVESPILTQITTLLFEGVQNEDWYDPYTAKVDKTRVTLLYDRVRSFNPGNESGKIINIKQWLPINKNIVYDDDENAQGMTSIPYSTEGKPGLGDGMIPAINQMLLDLSPAELSKVNDKRETDYLVSKFFLATNVMGKEVVTPKSPYVRRRRTISSLRVGGYFYPLHDFLKKRLIDLRKKL